LFAIPYFYGGKDVSACPVGKRERDFHTAVKKRRDWRRGGKCHHNCDDRWGKYHERRKELNTTNLGGGGGEGSGLVGKKKGRKEKKKPKEDDYRLVFFEKERRKPSCKEKDVRSSFSP